MQIYVFVNIINTIIKLMINDKELNLHIFFTWYRCQSTLIVINKKYLHIFDKS